MNLLSAKEYAHHRGVDPSYIAHLKAKGFLDSALVKQDGRKRVLIDAEKADKALEKNLDHNFIRGGAATTKNYKASETKADDSFIKARTESERYRASDRKLNYEIKMGKWVPKAQVRDEAFKAGRIFRDALLNIGPRIAALVTAETDEHTVLQIIQHEHLQVLRELVRTIRQMEVEE